MKVALIDMSLTPLSRRGGRSSTPGRYFQPSVHLMKVGSFCRRERIEARLLSFREEMEDLTRFSLVVVGSSVPESKASPFVRLSMESLGWPASCGKSVMESLYDMHEGTDLCVVGDAALLDGRPSLLGAEIDASPADPDLYAETLYLRRRIDFAPKDCRRRMLDQAFGRILREDGTMCPPSEMASRGCFDHLYIDDPDPAGLPDGMLAGFVREAAEKGLRIHFRSPLDLSRIDDGSVKALRHVLMYGRLFVKGYTPSRKALLLDLADSCGAKNLMVMETDVGAHASSDEEDVSAVAALLKSMYDTERIGVGYKCVLSDSAQGGRFGPLYRLVRDWRNNVRAYSAQTLDIYARWTAEALAKGGERARSEELADLYAEACDASPMFADLAKGYSRTAASSGRYVYRGVQRWRTTTLANASSRSPSTR